MPSRKRDPLTLAEALERFLTGYFSTAHRSERTFKAYSADLAQFVAFCGGDRRLVSLGPEPIEEWAAQLKTEKYAPASIQRKMVSLRVFFHFWLRRGVLDSSPFWRLRLRFGSRKQLPRTLTEPEVRALFAVARRAVEEAGEPTPGEIDAGYRALRNLALLDLLLATGIRVGEAASLTLSAFREDEGVLLVKGKGDRDRFAYLVVPQTLELQRRHLALRKSLSTPSDNLFLNNQARPLSTQSIAEALRTLATQANLTRRLTPHMLRHTAATFLLRNGMDIRLVQEFLGHASIVTTQRYTAVTREDLAKALSRHSSPARPFEESFASPSDN